MPYIKQGFVDGEVLTAEQLNHMEQGIYDAMENAGQGGGGDGGYYTPEVTQPTDSTMRVDFTASKSGMASVAPVTVTLPAGPAGPSYELTDTDKTEIVDAVLAALPNGDEVSY